jgi:hypothetical protein
VQAGREKTAVRAAGKKGECWLVYVYMCVCVLDGVVCCVGGLVYIVWIVCLFGWLIGWLIVCLFVVIFDFVIVICICLGDR